MKLSESVDLFKKQSLAFLAEFRSAEIENRNGEYQGRKYTVKGVTYNLEIDGKPIQLPQRLKDDTDMTTFKVPFARGNTVRVALNLAKSTKEKGLWDASIADIQLVEESK